MKGYVDLELIQITQKKGSTEIVARAQAPPPPTPPHLPPRESKENILRTPLFG